MHRMNEATSRSLLAAAGSQATLARRATVDLGRAGGPAGRTITLDVWAPDNERVRRLRYKPLGSTETLVWEFYDFGVAVDLTPPPPDKVR